MNNSVITITYESSLESKLTKLALEQNFISNLVNDFSEMVPDLVSKFLDSSKIFKTSFFDKPRIKELKDALSKTQTVIKHGQFINYKDTLVSVPEGFIGNLHNYITLLIYLNPVIYRQSIAYISDYNAMLSNFITNKDSRMCNTSHDSFTKKINKERDNYLGQMNIFFNVNSNLSKAKLGTLINRFSDLNNLTHEAIKLETLQYEANIQQIADLVDNAISLLQIIKNNLDEHQITEICGVAASSISEGAYYLAQYVEFISIFRFRCEQATTSVKNTLIKVSELK